MKHSKSRERSKTKQTTRSKERSTSKSVGARNAKFDDSSLHQQLKQKRRLQVEARSSVRKDHSDISSQAFPLNISFGVGLPFTPTLELGMTN